MFELLLSALSVHVIKQT